MDVALQTKFQVSQQWTGFSFLRTFPPTFRSTFSEKVLPMFSPFTSDFVHFHGLLANRDSRQNVFGPEPTDCPSPFIVSQGMRMQWIRRSDGRWGANFCRSSVTFPGNRGKRPLADKCWRRIVRRKLQNSKSAQVISRKTFCSRSCNTNVGERLLINFSCVCRCAPRRTPGNPSGPSKDSSIGERTF